MQRFLFIPIFCFVAMLSFGQTPKTDSIKRLIYSAKNDRAKLKAILNLCDEFEDIPKDTLWNYAIKAKMLAVETKDPQSFSMAILGQANAYLRWDNADSARALVEPELLKYKVEDAATRSIYFKLQHLKVGCISTTYTYKNAIADIYRLLREADRYKDSLAIAENMNSLSGLKYEMDFVPEAISWGLKGLSYTTNAPRFYTATMDLSGNLAEYYYWIDKLDSAMYYANKVLNLSKQTQAIYYQSWALQKKSAIYIKQKEYKKAEAAILQSIQLDAIVNGKEPSDDNLIALANVYERTKQFDKAIKVLTDGLAFEKTNKDISPHARRGSSDYALKKIFYYQELARSYHLKGDSKNYEAYLEKIIAGMTTFYKANSAQDIAELETKYQVQKKEATIAQQKLAITRENYLFYGSLVFLGLAGVIVWLLFRESRRKQQLKLQQLQDEEKRLAIKAVADAEDTERRRIAADLHDNLGAQLSFIKRNVNFIMDRPEGLTHEDEKKYLGYVNDIAQNAMIDLRETIWVLNKDEVSIQEFADKLKAYIKQQLMDKDAISWEFEEDISQSWKLSSGEVMHLFRIMQEVISNIIKHSGASQVKIKLISYLPKSYLIEVIDNGKGFDVGGKYDGHYGLENIQNRAREVSATILVDSAAETGTKIRLIKQQNNSSALYNGAPGNLTFTK